MPNHKGLQQSVFEMQSLAPGRCIWKFKESMSYLLQIISCSLLHISRIKFGCHAETYQHQTRPDHRYRYDAGVEQGMHGGISMISNKYSKANNPYLDANNLYG